MHNKDVSSIVAYTKRVIHWRWAIILFSIIIAILAASGANQLRFASDYRYFFGENNPQLRAFDQLQNTFIRDDSLLIVIRPDQDIVFTPAFLTALRC